ncbi:hypothetical protein HKCCE4037_14160 [Rhodobacterales bacterium HKCCE4037]|nr:hypothetical protein [Rhodobacterales bacterium HKCCE4037]
MSLLSVVDFAVSVAMLGLLSEVYGVIRRNFDGMILAPVALGILFGGLAVLQMARPFEAIDGVITDLRNVPIALAGAYLGWRGVLPAVIIAVLARLDQGGIGAHAGVVGIVFAGTAGWIWGQKTAILERRSYLVLVGLALAMSTHLFAGLLLPRDISIWFFTTAAGPILLMNLLMVPLLAAIMERKKKQIAQERRLSRIVAEAPNFTPLEGQAFADAVKSAFAAKPFGKFGGFLILGPKRTGLAGLLRKIFPVEEGQPKTPPINLARLVEHHDLAGRSADGRNFIPLTEAEVRKGRHLTHDLCRMCSLNCPERGARPLRRLNCHAQVLPVHSPSQFLRIVKCIAQSTQSDWSAGQIIGAGFMDGWRRGKPRKAQIFNPKEHDGLFTKADLLMEADRR